MNEYQVARFYGPRCTYQNLLMLVEILRSSERNKVHSFLRHGVAWQYSDGNHRNRGDDRMQWGMKNRVSTNMPLYLVNG